MNEQQATDLIKSSLQKLINNGMIPADTAAIPELILLGLGSPLDSIGFVVFVTDLEEKISSAAHKDLYLVLNEIQEFNINQPNLTVGSLAKYIVQLSKG